GAPLGAGMIGLGAGSIGTLALGGSAAATPISVKVATMLTAKTRFIALSGAACVIRAICAQL
ncbi:MAG TPA: hypothetical protein VNG52_06895, partial [Stellaceae bacterium]|nr:hypothetical protein [Stellaceae bacterium]